MRYLFRFIFLAICGLPGRAELHAQDLPPSYEAGVVELQAMGLDPVTVTALVDPRGEILLPLRALLDFAGIPFEVPEPGSRVILARPRGVGTATLDLGSARMIVARTIPLAREDAVAAEGEIYLSIPKAGELLEAKLTLERSILTVTLDRDIPFPAQQRLAVEIRRAGQITAGAAAPAASATMVPYRPRTGGGVVEWGLSTSLPNPGDAFSLRSQVGLGVWGGALTLGGGIASDPYAGVRVGDPTARYHRVFPSQVWVRQVSLGDVVGEGLRARPLRGFSVTNRRYIRDPLFEEIPLSPEVPPGWEYEVYQGGRLLGFSEAGSRKPVPVPLRYGTTPVEVRMYGPAGQVVSSQLIHTIPVLQLPTGVFEYAVGGGVCPWTGCRYGSYLDLRYGVARALTVVAGVEQTTDSVGSRVAPYAVLSLIPRVGWTAEVQAMPSSFYRATLQNHGTGRVAGSLGAGLNYPESGRFSFVDATDPRWFAETGFRLRLRDPGRSLGAVTIHGRAEGPSGRPADLVRLSAASVVRRIYVESGVESNPREEGPLVHLRTTGILPGSLSGRLRNVAVSAFAGAGADGLRQGEVTVSMQTSDRVALNLSTRWHAQSQTPVLSLSVNARLGPGTLQARTSTSAAGLGGTVAMDGGITFGGGLGSHSLPYGAIGTAGVRGRVFYDHDADGRFGPGDEPVDSAYVGIGGVRAVTDREGNYRTWAVLPYEVLTVGLDTLSLRDPGWFPPTRVVHLRPSPHLFSAVDFPLLRTRELAGKVVPGVGVATAGGVSVEVVNLDTGETQKVLTFSDGEFYVSRLRPGRYEIRPAESSLRALGALARPATLPLVVPAEGEEPLIEAPPIHLVRAR